MKEINIELKVIKYNFISIFIIFTTDLVSSIKKLPGESFFKHKFHVLPTNLHKKHLILIEIQFL